ncbi:MAG TPA: class I SAM-dependent methyltransferase [Thermoanaerobaculia bacterium]|nr:class I SAM-dependent methyltransferase [Thermoanaerobaculia bacterium]
MSLAHRPDETSPFVRAFLADRGLHGIRAAGPGNLDLAIDARDEMLGFLLESSEGDRERALFAYFRSGLSVADSLLQVLRWRFHDLSRIKVLDFASGYGRITRFLLREISPDRLWVSDVYADGVRFQEERFGVRGVVSTVRPEDFSLGETFDAILVTSLFTHLPEERFLAWLRVLCGRLNPGGVLAFSTHDVSLLIPRPEIPESGLLFQEISESGSLDTSDYGSTWVTEDFVRGAVARVSPSFSVHRLERALCNYQDLYVAVLEPGVDFSRLGFQAEPELSLERCELVGPDRLEMNGWAAARNGRAEVVEVLLDGELLASFPVDHLRPEVAETFGPGFLRSGWVGVCPLPPGLSRTSAVLLIRVRDGQGKSHLLRAGSLESLLLESARNNAAALRRELRETEDRLRETQAWANAEINGLQARIAAMKGSRFWKMRDAWFRLKRTLGLTRED